MISLMAVLHGWSQLWAEYPDYVSYPDPETVKQMVGGQVNEDWIKNTCAVRLSRTLNNNGVPLPSKFAGLLTLKGGDGKRYAIRVAEMRKWLTHALGAPDFDLDKKRGEDFDKTPISALKGIIAFNIHFADATGHLDLWDGSSYSSELHDPSEQYWRNATRITLWETAG